MPAMYVERCVPGVPILIVASSVASPALPMKMLSLPVLLEKPAL
jgi:hypothetical protein